MKVTYDKEALALYFQLVDGINTAEVRKTVESGDFKAAIYIDLDKDNKPVGFEILLDDDPNPEVLDILLKHFDITRK